MFNKSFFGLLAFSALFLASCGSDSATQGEGGASDASYQNRVIMHALSDPEELTPLNANDNGATMILTQTHSTLIHIDFKTTEIVPVLIKERPKFTKNADGTLDMDMEIRPEAVWDDGTPITGKDIAFTFKVLKNPETNSKSLKPYFDKVMDVEIDKENPKKFKVLYAEPYHAIESAYSDLFILQDKAYDPDGLMAGFTVNQLYKDAKGPKKLAKNDKIKDFAKQYNGPKYQREFVSGSGPYKFTKWETNQRVKLNLKKDWWGHKLKNFNHRFEANVEELVFESVNDLSTAVVALKGGKLDAMYGIPPKDFVTDLRKSEKFGNSFNTFTPPLYSYDYMCFNMRLEKFQDVRVRKALSHIMNVDQLIESYCYGLGVQVAGFIHPDIKSRLNENVKPYAYDLGAAKKLLAEAGWKDTNGNGIVDNLVDGEREDMIIKLNYNNGNARRERACLIFQEAARKAGVKVEIVPKEWAVMLQDNKVHKFEMFVMGWISSPLESDPKQIWHTSSANEEGSNYSNFGTPESDQLIEDLRTEMDDQKRFALYKRLQQIIHDEAPYIFLLAQKERIAIHKKYANSYGSGIRPGYWAPGFQVNTPTPN